MSAYMMLALMMYGREDDELTHVVINEEFETNPDFFFPPKNNQPMAIRVAGNKLSIINTSEARLEVAQIPFVRLRNSLGEDVGKVEKSLDELITIAQQQIDRTAPNKLAISLSNEQVRFGSQKIKLRGIRLALLAYYADTKINHCQEPGLPVCGDCQKCFTNPVKDAHRFQSFYQRLYAGAQPEDAPKSKLEFNLMSYHTKLNEALQPLLFKVISQREWGETTYGLNLDKNLIELI